MAHEINLWSFGRDDNNDFKKNVLFGTLKLTKNSEKDKYKYSRYRIGFDNHGTFSLSNGSGFGRNVIIFGADMSSSVHDHNKNKDILILGKGPTDGLDDATLTAEKEYSINFTEHNKKICLNLYFHESSRYIFVNGVKIHKFKAKDSEIRATPLCLGKDFERLFSG